jgi:hypothetical protein
MRTSFGRGLSKSSRFRYNLKLARLADKCYGGKWKVTEHGNGRIVLVDTTVVKTVSLEEVHKNAVQTCAVRRYAHMSPAVTRDISIGRQVPWTCVTAAWAWLKGPAAEQPRSFYAGPFPFAGVDLKLKVTHLLECMEHGWTNPAWPSEGELWIRWGVDGVPRWAVSYVTLTVALGGEHHSFKMHSVERFAHCAMLCGTESVDSVTALFKASGLNEALEEMEGSQVEVMGKSLRVRSFLLGDHMLQYKATGADIQVPLGTLKMSNKKLVFLNQKKKNF